MSNLKPARLVTEDRDPHGILHKSLRTAPTTLETALHYFPQMIKLCKGHNGVGLAANQAGIEEDMFVAAAAAGFPSGVDELCLHPVWRPAPKAATVASDEGCLSFPGKTWRVQRWTRILAEWINKNGKRQAYELKGLAACVFQHECDHLDGVTLADKGDPVERKPRPGK